MLSQMMGAVLISSLMVQAASAAESYVFKTKEPQQMAIINTGSLSLQKRLQMIESAKRTIEVEFFIYNIDEAGRLFTQALVKKAREGVQVRVLIDYGWPIAKLDTFYATLLEQNGVLPDRRIVLLRRLPDLHRRLARHLAQRHEAELGRAAVDELQRLRDVLAGHDLGCQRHGEAEPVQHRHRGSSVGRSVRVGDGNVMERPGFKHRVAIRHIERR